MSWYNQPIQPLDPVVSSQTPKPPFRYLRDNFAGTGQNSFIKPPAQDQSMWQSLVNIMPITQGVLDQRWGYVTLGNFINQVNRLHNYQSDVLGTRAILGTGIGIVEALNEDGTIYNSSVFVPQSQNIMRSATSRNYQYFCNGNNALDPVTHRTGDSLKWNGAATDGVTNVGIVNTDVMSTTPGGSTSNTVGPDAATSAVDNGGSLPWSNVNGMFQNNPASPASVTTSETFTSFIKPNGCFGYNISNAHLASDSVNLTKYGFTSVPGTVAGLQVGITYQATGDPSFNPVSSLTVTILKNNAVVGTSKVQGLILDNAVHTVTLGSASDLWGTSFAGADITSSTFGVQVSAHSTFKVTRSCLDDGSGTATSTIKVSAVPITVYLGAGGGTSTTSGNGVGIFNGVGGGAVNLTIGRIYYLVGNNSLTGHFSDLSSASGSSGAATNAEFNLLLAVYNDPQVDTKFVLATSDGGDPSILYQVKVLVPGMIVTSWAIAANVVTFTGTFPNAQFKNGDTFIAGGFSHGSYLNNQTMTVTGVTPTTVTAAFTHGNDSATETGILGNYTFAIPNNVTQVVDNNTDPDLVTNQVMVFTDIFGNEFGLTQNTPPPGGNLLVKHQGRMWMAGVTGSTHSVFFSKAVSDLTLPNGFVAGKYEESWPGDNLFDVSDGAESVSGFLSDGTTLYIGTQNHIRRILGNDPTNFQQPQIVHPQTGLINQEVWQLTFMQGAPSGSIWMTPDFRVIQSDFNTYLDIGQPVQDILNNLKVTAPSLAHASFVSDGEFELYILAVPFNRSDICDTHLVFDLHSRKWFVWQPTNGSVAMLFNITQAGASQWLFVHKDTDLHKYDRSTPTDVGTIIPCQATTTWLHMGEPTRRKVLSEIQVFGDNNILMDVYAANNNDDFNKPIPVVYNRALRRSVFGIQSLYLTGDKSRHRYYQLTFKVTDTLVPFLGSFSISASPLEDL